MQSNETAIEEQEHAPDERRASKRSASLIRAGKLVSARGEFVCTIRDASQDGIALKMFHEFPQCPEVALELRNGASFELKRVHGEGDTAGFAFADDIDVVKLLDDNWHYPKRGVRLNITMPIKLETRDGTVVEAFTDNISQQGAGIECQTAFAVNQPLMLSSDHLAKIPAKVRWCRDGQYGLVFDNTFSLRDFALLGARLQCPGLVPGEDRLGWAA
ncbi:PilZ domain-containing protein [Erythrobacter sp. W53]|uniref:PilZ domain-containing protein n=1 Tax=Erythrobacter sp. W53 TaxID=3425947 RepID=UPI003D768A22